MDIVIIGLTKSYEDKQVLNDFNARFFQGSTTCIMGDSGCGKTTLLNILLGFIEPDDGVIKGLPERIGVVYQEDRLCEAFSAVSNIHLVTGNHHTKDEFRAVLARLGIAAEDADKPVCEFSGGMKRRVAIARALMYDCDLLLFDEAFKGLDGETKRLVMDCTKELAHDRTIILVTHDPQEAEYLGGVLIRMERK